MPKKLKRGTLWDFSTSILSQNIKKLKGGFRNKVTMPKKTERGDALVSPGMVCYAEKEEKPFWLSSLGQMSQFGTIKLCRTFKNYFGQFVWIEKKREKKRVTIVVAFHFMKPRLKTGRSPDYFHISALLDFLAQCYFKVIFFKYSPRIY